MGDNLYMAFYSQLHVYQHCGEETGFNVRSMIAQYYSVLPILHSILQKKSWKLQYFTCLSILKVEIVQIKNYDCVEYFSIVSFGKSCGSCGAKLGKK